MRSPRPRAGAVMAALALSLPLAAGCSSSSKPANSTFAQAAKQAIDDLAAGNFGNITSHFDPEVAAHYSGAQLAGDWQAFQDKAGNYVSHGEPKEVKKGDLTIEQLSLKLSKHTGQFQVTYHPDGTIAGIHFQQA